MRDSNSGREKTADAFQPIFVTFVEKSGWPSGLKRWSGSQSPPAMWFESHIYQYFFLPLVHFCMRVFQSKLWKYSVLPPSHINLCKPILVTTSHSLECD